MSAGRLRPGTMPQEAARDLTALVPRIPQEYPGEDINAGMIEQAQFGALVHPLRDDVVGEVEGLLWILLGAVGVVLVIACANVATLFLVHAEGQQGEVAVPTALGASRGDVARVFLSESLLLAVAGGALGLPLAAGGLKLLLQLAPEGSLPRAHQIGLDGTVVTVTLVVSLCSGLLFGLGALLRYGTPQLGVALKEGSRGGTASRARHLGRHLLVGAQVALALVLLISSGLMVRSFQHLRNVHSGITPPGVLTARVALPEREYATDEAVGRFVQQVLDRVAALPGVAAASAIDILPLSGGGNTNGYSIEDFPRRPDDLPPILSTRSVAPAYFETMRIPLLAGRTFDRADHERRTGAVVISESVARRFWPRQSPLGCRLAPGIDSGEPAWYTIVGVVASVRD